MNPHFSFPQGTWSDQNGRTYTSTQFLQGWIILYCYPKDNTPGCTRQACDLRDQWSRWASVPVQIYGLSPDSIDSHKKFASQYVLPFPLLSDPEHLLCTALGVWGQQTWKGHHYIGLERSTWILFNGQVQASFREVQVQGHWDQVWEKWTQLNMSLTQV